MPGRGVVHVSDVVAPAATSVENDWTRCPCAGGVAPAPPAIGQVVAPGRWEWAGLGVVFAVYVAETAAQLAHDHQRGGHSVAVRETTGCWSG